MRLMLVATHEKLLQSLRDVHAAELQVLQTKLSHSTEKLLDCQKSNQYLATKNGVLSDAIVSQQKTIQTAMSDLVILKGAGRVRTEREKIPDPPELQPDIEITDAPTDLASRRKLISDAQREYDEALARLTKEVDISKVTSADVAAAIPESVEAWRAEHAQPSDDSLDLVAGV